MKNYSQYIETNHNIMLGKPVIKGTRITVELLLRKLSQGATFENLAEMYPSITISQYHAVLEYAANIIANEKNLEFAQKNPIN
jgi:uncharacterized protein (DUF433 family)